MIHMNNGGIPKARGTVDADCLGFEMDEENMKYEDEAISKLKA